MDHFEFGKQKAFCHAEEQPVPKESGQAVPQHDRDFSFSQTLLKITLYEQLL